MLWVIVAALMVIYLVLAMQMNSYCLPIIILLGSVPFAGCAALVMLYLSCETLNIYTEIGLLTLLGLISKHGILIIDVAGQQHRSGRTAAAAIIGAVKCRFRPIVMTTAAMLVGVLPLIFASGAGSNSRAQLGVVLASGLGLGTILTLLLLPVLYLTINRISTRSINESSTHHLSVARSL